MNSHIQKKGDLSLNLIVMSIIALLVLVIIIYLFTSKTGVAAKGFSGCAERGGHCTIKPVGPIITLDSCVEGELQIPGDFSDCKKEQDLVCCKKLGI